MARFLMKSVKDSICIKLWQAYALLALPGFAVGSILAKITNAVGL